jgi:amino acid carrier protein
METVTNINTLIGDFVWGPVMLIFIVGVGVYFTVRTKWYQIGHFKEWNKNTIGLLFKKDSRKARSDGSVTQFQAFCTAMAATAGTGNLVGVAAAIGIGGPGAVFWMLLSGFFGMMTKYAEIVLAIHFRERNEKGDWVGGPMYYIKKGLGKNFGWLATLFAIFTAVCAFGIGNMTQINAVSGTAGEMLKDLGINLTGQIYGFEVYKVVMGVVLAVLVALVIMGGLQRIGDATERLIPFVGILNIIACVVAIVIKADNIIPALASVFKGAFSLEAVGGGVTGYVMMLGIRYGIARGVFTNEAGLGSAPIAHAAADTDHPVKQGMWGVFEVFADTIVMCTLSAMVVLTSGVYTGFGQDIDGAALISQSFKASFGVGGSIFLAFSILIFAYCTTLSWSLYGQRCFEFLTKGRFVKAYQLIFSLCVVVAAVMQLDLAWAIADTLNGLMAIPNLIALMALSGIVIRLTKEYYADKQGFKSIK